ncbi:hypothetical protein M123_0685 [Bacteroides fragilis str. 3976T8]|uniref:Uncharacterized protein n=1 Tax=Bacteroides fragilis str. 3976T8 TaxID=1339314 RepID=A0A016C209_BACFG|nr:hypothetical protein M123_0685 [Bacteroides fragilis str. 3976T8]
MISGEEFDYDSDITRSATLTAGFPRYIEYGIKSLEAMEPTERTLCECIVTPGQTVD